MLGSGVEGILHDVSQYALESFAMGQHGNFRGIATEHRPRMSQAFRLDDALEKGLERHRLALVDGCLLHQLRHQPAHALFHMANRIEHVRLKLRIVLVALGIAQHQ